MLSTPRSRGELFLASSLRDGVEDNDLRQVQTLLSTKYADPNVIIPSHGVSPFHLIIGHESLQFAERVTKLFIRHGGDPNVKSVEGLTPVHIAAAWGRINILELLLANGGDPLCLDNEGRTPFHYAFDGTYYNAVSILGKYCGMSCDEEEEEPKFKLTLDKIFVNKGNVVAEYVPSDDSHEFSIESKFAKDTCHERRSLKASSSNQILCSKDSEADLNWSRSNNVTVRRYKKQRSPLKFSEIYDECNIEDEKILVDKIIRRLSSTLLDDSNENEKTIIERKNCKTERATVKKKGDSTKEKPRRILFGNTSIISKSPNCKIFTTYDKTPKNNIVASRICGSSCKKNANDKSSRFKPSKPPEMRVNSASSTPKKKLYNSRLYGSPKMASNSEKIRKYVANDAKSVTPKFCNEIRDKEGKIVEYSPDTFIKVPRRVERNRHIRNIAVKLDDLMYDENPEVHDDSCSKSHSDHETSLMLKIHPIEIENGKKNATPQSEEKQIEMSKNDEAQDYSRAFESPGSSNPLSVCSLQDNRDGTLNVSRDEEEMKILLEIEEAWEKRCGTPPASVSMLEHDDDIENEGEHFHSDYSSGDSTSICEFYEADPGTMSFWSRHQSFVSVDEEYTYEDQDKGVAFIERHLRIIPTRTNVNMNQAKDETSWIDQLGELSIASSERLSPSSSVIAKTAELYDDRLLRERLTALGDVPGPITKTTFNVYLKRLWRLERTKQKKDEIYETNMDKIIDDVNSTELRVPNYLLIIDWTTKIEFYRSLEEKAFKEYAMANPKRRYRGGVSKNSFCYLLLDPRITKDLPRNGIDLTIDGRWKRFLEAVFYVGKGKAARPAAHLYDAFGVWTQKQETIEGASRKIRRILDIWQSGRGVVCLHVFSHTMTEEACSREAAMIEALGTSHLTNCLQGTYYGYATTMNGMEKRSLGKYLLYKSMEILMHEGERQLFPRNVVL